MLTLGLALVATVAGVWLLQYALRREQRGKAGVAVVGAILLVCAVALLVIELVIVGEPEVVQGPG